MGSIARMSRSERFIREFEKDFVELRRLRAGSVLTVVNVFLGQEDSSLEQVKLCIQVRDRTGDEFVLEEGEAVFDPENDYGNDLVERVAAELGSSEHQAKKRLMRAKLLVS
jgi:hypothetical protein